MGETIVVETLEEFVIVESAFERLTEHLMNDLPNLELLQTLRAHFSLMRVKLTRSLNESVGRD